MRSVQSTVMLCLMITLQILKLLLVNFGAEKGEFDGK